MARSSGTKRALAKTATTAAVLAGSVALHAPAYADEAAEAAGVVSEIRAIDGSNNNKAHPTWGATGTNLLRDASGMHYADGISTMARPNSVSPRSISNGVFKQEGSIPSHLGVSDYIWTFGQFLDHDFSLTEGMGEDGRTDAFISIPAFDPFFDPFGTGTQKMSFHRGVFDPATGTTTPRQQFNEITGYIDGSNVYGSDDDRAHWLRTFSNGRLKVTTSAVGDLAPYNDGTVGNAGSPEKPDLSTTLFVAGDIRINEQPTLCAMHILFVREHNWQAARIANEHRTWTDEQIYQAARKIVIGELQHITIDEFVPALFGNAYGIGPYQGYDSKVNAGISAVFSTAAYRIGHTLLSSQIQRLGPDGKSIPQGPLGLKDSFFAATPPMIASLGIEPFLRGVAAQKSQELDNKVIDDVRNFLFGLPGAGGLDLISLNLQRGRDLGLPDFNTIRADYGLPKYTKFSQITSNPALANQLKTLFGTVDNIDPFAGLFAEDHEYGYNIGRTLRAVFTNQFRRIRTGDRFWYERALNSDDLYRVQHTRFSDIIKRNTTITSIQKNVFFVPGYSQPDYDTGY